MVENLMNDDSFLLRKILQGINSELDALHERLNRLEVKIKRLEDLANERRTTEIRS